MTIYRGVGSVNREIKQQFRGVGGVNREIKEQYRGSGGVNRKVFTNIIDVHDVTITGDPEYALATVPPGDINVTNPISLRFAYKNKADLTQRNMSIIFNKININSGDIIKLVLTQGYKAADGTSSNNYWCLYANYDGSADNAYDFTEENKVLYNSYQKVTDTTYTVSKAAIDGGKLFIKWSRNNVYKCELYINELYVNNKKVFG